MATPGSPSQRKDFQEQFLTCSICAEPYDNGDHQVKCLPCLHSYCKSCLLQHAGKQTKLSCPNCRKLITLPGGSIDHLPNNFIVENLKEYQGLLNFAVTCGSCDHRNPAVRFCHDCGCFLCQGCVENHRMRSLRHHKLSTMVELQQQKYNPKMQQHRCKKHPKQEVTFYCKEANCKLPVCASCGLVDHQGHDLVDLTSATDEVVASIQQSCSRIMVRNQELTRKRDTFETMQKRLTDNFNQKEKDLQESQQKLNDSIKSRYSQAHSHVKHMYQTEMMRLMTNMECIDVLTAQMTSACEFANKACDMTHPTQLLTSNNQIMDRLHELENTELPKTASDKTDFVFTDKHCSAKVHLQESLQQIWTIKWTQRTSSLHSYWKEVLVLLVSLISLLYLLSSMQKEVDPSRCIIQLGQSVGLFGHFEATVQTVDSDGQLITTGGAKVEATQLWDKLQVQDSNDGTYVFNYRSLFGDSVYVRINGRPMTGSPFHVQPEVDPSCSSIHFGPPTRKVTGATLHEATIKAVNYNGQLSTTGGAKVEVTQHGFELKVQDNMNGMYTFEYNPNFDQIDVKINGEFMKGSPFDCWLQVDPSRSTILLGQSVGMYGYKKATVQTFNSNGQLMTIGRAKVEATQLNDKLQVHDNNDGTYTLNYHSRFGNSVHVRINGKPMTESPFQVQPEVDPMRATIELGQQLQKVKGTILADATVQTADCSGKLITTGGAKVQATQHVFDLQVQDNNDGTYTFKYNPNFGQIDVKINGIPMEGSPFDCHLEVDPTQCTIQVHEETTDDALYTATVQLVDHHGWLITTSGAKVEASSECRFRLPQLYDNNDGTYTVIYDNRCLVYVHINDKLVDII